MIVESVEAVDAKMCLPFENTKRVIYNTKEIKKIYLCA